MKKRDKMKRIKKTLDILKRKPISVIVRTSSTHNAYKVLKNTLENGFNFAEITLTVPQAYDVIKFTSQKYKDAVIGAGTVLTLAEAEKAIQSGARYLVAPVYNEEILKWSLKNDILYVPGVMTVNEMFYAVQQGAQLLKFYPAVAFDINFLKLIFQPFPQFKILATGGIDLMNIKEFFQAGVYAVGITGKLGDPSDETSDEDIANLSKQYIGYVDKITSQKEGKM